MNESRISVRYSRALFQSALDKKLLGRINQDMILVKDVCTLPEMKELLSNPVIVPSKKTEVLHNLLGRDLHNLTMSMIDLVVKNGREAYIPAIARVFIHDTKKHDGITETILTTAVKVDSGIKKQVTDMIAAIFKTRVDLKENIDNSIIGGFILKIEDDYIDASVRNKLRKIRKELNAGSMGTRII
jgi:F-type H+-transporting ATPase subunit delta